MSSPSSDETNTDSGAEAAGGPAHQHISRSLYGRWIFRTVAVLIIIALISLIALRLTRHHGYAYDSGFTSGRDFARLKHDAGLSACDHYWAVATVDFPNLKPSDKSEFLKGCYAGLKHPK